jgi:hypothetical protein
MVSGFDLTGTARSLLNIEVNTIVRDNMTAEQMPPLPHAVLDIAGDYARELCALGVDLQAYFATPLADPTAIAHTWRDNPGSVSDLLTVSADTFDRLRWAAKNANQAQGPQAARITPAKRALLDRIVNNCDAIKEMFKRFGPSLNKFIGKTRAELVGMIIRRGSYVVQVDDLIALQKMWDIGVEEIVAQTLVHVTGDITMRVHDAFRRPGSETLFAIHRQSIDVSVACWHYLLDVIREIAGATVRVLLGRTG